MKDDAPIRVWNELITKKREWNEVNTNKVMNCTNNDVLTTDGIR